MCQLLVYAISSLERFKARVLDGTDQLAKVGIKLPRRKGEEDGGNGGRGGERRGREEVEGGSSRPNPFFFFFSF